MRRLAVLLLLASGCAVGPNYKRPEIGVPKSFSEGKTGPTTFERWWNGFHDPILESLVVRAVQGNLDLKISAARIREARAARGIAAAAGLPQLQASGGYSRSKQLVARVDGVVLAQGSSAQSIFEAGFDASWEIDIFGGVRRDEEAAVAQVQAAEEAREDVLVTLVADVARDYIELRGADRQIEILDQTVEAQKESLALAQSRFDSGMGTEFDVTRAQGLVAATVAQRPILEILRHQATFRLGVLLGQEPEALLAELEAPRALPSAPPEVPLILPSELLSRRPDLRRSERELAAATARIGVATADLFPRFNLLGSFGRRTNDLASFNASNQFWRGALAVSEGHLDRAGGSRERALGPWARAAAAGIAERFGHREPPRPRAGHRAIHERPGELPRGARRAALTVRRRGPAGAEREKRRRRLDRSLQGAGRWMAELTLLAL